MANFNIYDTGGNVAGKLQSAVSQDSIIMYLKPNVYPAPLVGKVVVGQHVTGTWILITIIATEVEGDMVRVLGKYAGNAIGFKPKLTSVLESAIQDIQHTLKDLIPSIPGLPSLPGNNNDDKLNLPLIGMIAGGGVLALLLLRGGNGRR